MLCLLNTCRYLIFYEFVIIVMIKKWLPNVKVLENFFGALSSTHNVIHFYPLSYVSVVEPMQKSWLCKNTN